ncbi:MAG: hypothetical protein ACRD3W_19795 [Terriglobales bacterium]
MSDKSQLLKERSELAQQQESLIAALLEQGKAPNGTAEIQVAATARSLLLKRARTIARQHPEALAQCGKLYVQIMTEYATVYPGVHPQGACADAARFRCYLRQIRRRSIWNRLFGMLQ